MRTVTILSAVYPPEPLVSARMGHDVANFLATTGHQTTVVCPQPSRPITADYNAYRDPLKPIESFEDSVKVARLPSFAAPIFNILDRARESYSFGCHAYRYLASQTSKPDVLYINAWPLLSQALIIRFAKKNRIPIVLQIMDIYPESLITKLSGPITKIASSPLRRLDAWIAQQAVAVVVISDNMRQAYIDNRGIPPEKVITINTWQDEELFNLLPDKREAFARYGIPNDRFTFLYLGNIGPVAGVEFLINTFYKANLDKAQLVIVGDGSAKDACKKLADCFPGDNIRFISDPDVNNVPLMQSMADVFLLPLKPDAGMSSIPSKLAAYLFSAKPVLATVDANSDTARLIRQAECGWVGEPGNIDWLVAKMREIASLPIYQLNMLGQCGLNYGISHFSKAKGVKRLANIVLANAKKS